MTSSNRRLDEVLCRFVILTILSVDLSIVTANYVTCGENIIDQTSGTVTSPNYPQDYPPNSDCTWWIISTNGREITLEIDDLNNEEVSVLGGFPTCYDKLNLYHVTSGKQTLVGRRLCASPENKLQKTKYVFSPTAPGRNIARIEFTSDNSDQFSGFSISFKLDVETTTELVTTTTTTKYNSTPLTIAPITVPAPSTTTSNTQPATTATISTLPVPTTPIYTERNATTPVTTTTSPVITTPVSTTTTSKWHYTTTSIGTTVSAERRNVTIPTTIEESAANDTASTSTSSINISAWTKSGTTAIRTTKDSNQAYSIGSTRAPLVDKQVLEPQNDSSKSTMILAIVSVVLGLILIVCAIVYLVRIWKRKHTPTSESNVVFQNLTHDTDDGETDEYGRPRENTYVEIPLLPQEEPSFTGNGKVPTSLCRSSSRHSIDSIAREKLEEALSSRPEAQSTRPPEPCPPLGKKTEPLYHLVDDDVETEKNDMDSSPAYLQPSCVSAINSPTFEIPAKFSFSSENCSSQVYAMADDNEENSVYHRPSSLKAKNLADQNDVNVARKDHAEPTAKKEESFSGLPEGIYNFPTTPPCDPLLTRKTESFYDHPKQPPQTSNPALLKKENIPRTSTRTDENNYCTMTGSLDTESNAPSQKSSPSGSFSTAKLENIPQNSSLYVPMLPQ